MIVKQIIDEDFVNYKKPAMLIIFPKCSWKCGKEICHNREIASLPDIEISIENILWRYTKNTISEAVVCSGLEPFDSYDDLINLLVKLRANTSAPIIIYTGYTEEIISQYKELYKIENIIVKFGEYISGHQPHYDSVLGVNLSSDNQYAKQIS